MTVKIKTTDWTVQITREAAFELGLHPGTGPYFTLAIFDQNDAKERAERIVEKMKPILGNKIWAWSGKDIAIERKSRLG